MRDVQETGDAQPAADQSEPPGWPARSRRPPPGPFRPASGAHRCAARGSRRCSARVLLVLVGVVAVTGFLSHAAYAPDLRGNAIVRPAAICPSCSTGRRARVAVRAHPGAAHDRRAGRRARPAGQAVVGHPAPVRLAAARHARPGARAGGARAARGERRVRARHRRGEHAVLVPVRFNFVVAHYYGAVVFVACSACTWSSRRRWRCAPSASAACWSPCATTSRARPRAAGAGLVAERRPPRRSPAVGCSPASGSARSPLRSPTPASRSAGRCARWPCWRRGGRRPAPGRTTSRSTRRRRRRRDRRDDGRGGWRLRPARRDAASGRCRAQDLLAMPQRTETLPIACVEGWSTTQRWTGVPLAALAGTAGGGTAASVRRVAAAARRVRASVAAARPGRRPAVAARAAGQRRRPVARPRLPRPRDRAGAAGRAQHQVGRGHDVRGARA